jgi:hypothetical protein
VSPTLQAEKCSAETQLLSEQVRMKQGQNQNEFPTLQPEKCGVETQLLSEQVANFQFCICPNIDSVCPTNDRSLWNGLSSDINTVGVSIGFYPTPRDSSHRRSKTSLVPCCEPPDVDRLSSLSFGIFFSGTR